jgi:hypothetical protein
MMFGNAASEGVHDFHGPGTILGTTNAAPLQYPQNVTYRQIGADANHTHDHTITDHQSTFITVTVRLHPSLPTYITLTIYGSHNQTGVIMLF